MPRSFPRRSRKRPSSRSWSRQGKLPPVAERIGQDPLVIKPLHEVGKYGGTWRGGFTGPADFWNGFRCCSGPDHLMFWDYTGDRVTPNLARGLEMQDGGRAWLVQLRRGMKWSDGKPFTADDFVFWFEDVYRNKDLIPTPSATMAINGKQGVIEKVDTYTVRFKFPDPYFMLPDVLAGSTDLAGQMWGYRGMGGFAPAHYMKQFHPKYVGQAELDKKVKDAKFDSWVRMFLFKNDWALNPELPVLSAWKTVTPINTPTWTLERNPYSVFVDTAGNQLPYIDKVVLTLAENLEVLNLRADRGRVRLPAAAHRYRQAARVPREPGQGQLQGLSRSRRLRLRHDHQVQPELRRRPRDRQVVQHRRFPSCAVARASTATRSTRRSGSAPGRRAPRCRRTATSTTPGRSTGRCGPRSTSEEGQRDARQDRAHQEGR